MKILSIFWVFCTIHRVGLRDGVTLNLSTAFNANRIDTTVIHYVLFHNYSIMHYQTLLRNPLGTYLWRSLEYRCKKQQTRRCDIIPVKKLEK